MLVFLPVGLLRARVRVLQAVLVAIASRRLAIAAMC
jgi:hypothetical protein